MGLLYKAGFVQGGRQPLTLIKKNTLFSTKKKVKIFFLSSMR
jgi:hypothetical protein